MEELITLYTDGGTLNNGSKDAVGTCAFLLKPIVIKPHEPLVAHTFKYSGTTNNRMEMMAAIKAIEWCARNTSGGINMKIVSDSIYLVKGMTDHAYLDRWIANGWKTTSKTDVKNVDLWTRLNVLRYHNGILWTHIRGHGKCLDDTHRFYNDICDAACTYTYGLSTDHKYVLVYDIQTKRFAVVEELKNE